MRPFTAALVLASSLAAQNPPRPAPCASPEHHQFDFWLGEWEVRDPEGHLAGRNRIESIACGLQEHWSDLKGGTGTSLNAYNAATKRWHQTWVGGGGGVILLDGGLVDGRMVLEGRNATAKGPVLDRITWSPEGRDAQGRDRVRQLWEQSRDEGRTWTVAFDGRYTRIVKP
ncbi:MAG TPA: hypothetical protein VJ600_06835 [Holophagaceae bacterium]|nr:hypothetical protein [Holophagaceae bacterium]